MARETCVTCRRVADFNGDLVQGDALGLEAAGTAFDQDFAKADAGGVEGDEHAMRREWSWQSVRNRA